MGMVAIPNYMGDSFTNSNATSTTPRPRHFSTTLESSRKKFHTDNFGRFGDYGGAPATTHHLVRASGLHLLRLANQLYITEETITRVAGCRFSHTAKAILESPAQSNGCLA
jgi:hypothetical protein